MWNAINAVCFYRTTIKNNKQMKKVLIIAVVATFFASCGASTPYDSFRKENKEDKSLFCFIVFKTTSDLKGPLE